MTQEELEKILENHRHGLNEDCEGWETMRANLRGVDLYRADLSGADLSGAFNVPYIPMVCPEEGEFIGWKKSRDNIIIKLHIPEDAKRSSATTRKCRCSKARVVAFYDLKGNEITDVTETKSRHNKEFVYRLGKMAEVADFDDNRWEECCNGIHFFMQRNEAKEYDFR